MAIKKLGPILHPTYIARAGRRPSVRPHVRHAVAAGRAAYAAQPQGLVRRAGGGALSDALMPPSG